MTSLRGPGSTSVLPYLSIGEIRTSLNVTDLFEMVFEYTIVATTSKYFQTAIILEPELVAVSTVLALIYGAHLTVSPLPWLYKQKTESSKVFNPPEAQSTRHCFSSSSLPSVPVPILTCPRSLSISFSALSLSTPLCLLHPTPGALLICSQSLQVMSP